MGLRENQTIMAKVRSNLEIIIQKDIELSNLKNRIVRETGINPLLMDEDYDERNTDYIESEVSEIEDVLLSVSSTDMLGIEIGAEEREEALSHYVVKGKYFLSQLEICLGFIKACSKDSEEFLNYSIMIKIYFYKLAINEYLFLMVNKDI